MIIKGGPRGKGRALATHLMRADTNETVRVFDLRGVFSGTVRGALAEMEAVAAGSKVTKPLYHVSINPEAGEALTPAQWKLAADRLEAALGMEGHQRVMVEHLKQGRTHMHIAWGRVDPDTMKAAHHSHNYRTHEEVARDLEREFGLNRTQGVHAERDTEKKKPRARDEKRPTTMESQQEARTGFKKAEAQAAILNAWTHGETGAAFRALLEADGYRLAQGDHRDYVIVDPAGGPHSIRSGVKGLRVADIRERFADLPPKDLPTVKEAQVAALAAYPAYCQQRAARQTAHQAAASFPARSVRPATPEPGRYDALRAAPPSAHDRPPPAQAARLTVKMAAKVTTRVTPGIYDVTHRNPPASQKPPPEPSRPLATPQPTPTPPTWARNPEADPPERPAPKPVATTPPPSAALQDLKARQDQDWLGTLARLGEMHGKAISSLETHHAERLAKMNVEVDTRLAQLNGLSSRAGALFNREDRDREIAYLVAKRQRSLADEQARQEKVKDDLRRAHAHEIAEAKAQHDRHAALQQQTLEARTAREQSAPQPGTRPIRRNDPRDYER